MGRGLSSWSYGDDEAMSQTFLASRLQRLLHDVVGQLIPVHRMPQVMTPVSAYTPLLRKEERRSRQCNAPGNIEAWLAGPRIQVLRIKCSFSSSRKEEVVVDGIVQSCIVDLYGDHSLDMRDLDLGCQQDTFCYAYNPYDRRLEELDAEDYDIPGTQVRQSLHYSKGVQTLCLISTVDIDRGTSSARVTELANGNKKKAENTTLTSRFIDTTTRRLRSAFPSAKQWKTWKATLPSRLKSLATRQSRPILSTSTDSGSDSDTEPFLRKGATASLFLGDDDVSTTGTTEEDTKVWVAPPNSLGGSVTLHCIESPIYAHLNDQERKLGFKVIESCFLPEDSDGIVEIQNFLLQYPVHTLYGYNPITEEFIDFYDHHKREIDVDRLQRCLWYPEAVLDDRSVTICFVSTVDEKRRRDREYQAMDTSSEARVVSRLLNGLASIPTCMSTLRVDGTQILPLWWGFFLSRMDEASGIRECPKVVVK